MTFLTTRRNRNNDVLSLFDEFFNDWAVEPTSSKSQLREFTPAINLKENEEAYIVEAELAGIKKEEIDITIKDHTIVLKGERKFESEDKKENYHRVERRYGSFYRTIPLGSDADDEKVKASFQDGLLTIEVAKHTTPDLGHRKIHIG